MPENNIENKGSGEDKKVVASNFLANLEKSVDKALNKVKSSIKNEAERIGKEASLYFSSSSIPDINMDGMSFGANNAIARGLKAKRGNEEDISAEMYKAKREARRRGEIWMSDLRLHAYADEKAKDLGSLSRYQKKRKSPSRPKNFFVRQWDNVHRATGLKGLKDWRESVLEEYGYDKGFRQKLKNSKKEAKKSKKIKEGAKKKKPGVMSKIRELTGKILKSSYKAIPSTFTLSMFIVYIYVFIRQIPQVNKPFCPIGQEWVPYQIKISNPEKAKKIGDRIAIAEKPFIGCSCLFHIFIIIAIAAIIYFIRHPGKVGWTFLESWANNVFGADNW